MISGWIGRRRAAPVSEMARGDSIPPLRRSRRNNFDLIRLSLSIIVMFSHIFSLLPADYGVLRTITHYIGPRQAVSGFFVISGFLIFRSLRNSSGIIDYFDKRARRLYPGLTFSIFVAISLGFFVTTIPHDDYFGVETLRYAFYNLLFMTFKQQTLPGVFGGNEFHYVNGALWTLKIEVMFYFFVPVFMWISRHFLGFERLAVITYLGSVAYQLVLNRLALTYDSEYFAELARQLPGQLSFFMAGALLEYRPLHLKRFGPALVAGSIGVLLLNLWIDMAVLYPLCLAVLVIYACQGLPFLGNFSKWGDLSYGLYVLHYPIVQTFFALGILAMHPTERVVAVVMTSLGAAFLSWHLVERHWIADRPRPAPSAPALPPGIESVAFSDRAASTHGKSPG